MERDVAISRRSGGAVTAACSPQSSTEGGTAWRPPSITLPGSNANLISRLYHQARTERVPMTALASRLVREGLAGRDRESSCIVAEEPPAYDPGGRKE